MNTQKDLPMFNRLALAIICLLNFPANASAKDPVTDRDLMQQIVTNLNRLTDSGELAKRDLTITVYKGDVTVTGRIEDPAESRMVLQSIISSNGIRGINLNLGVGSPPSAPCSCALSPPFDAELSRRPLSWDDGHWQLDWAPANHPVIHRTKR